jgi:hypothetical protein
VAVHPPVSDFEAYGRNELHPYTKEDYCMHFDLIIRHTHLHRRPGLVDLAVQVGFEMEFADAAFDVHVLK